MQDLVGTPERLSALRTSCLTRDRHRCVVSHVFDTAEVIIRWEMEQQGHSSATDDEGNPLVDSDEYDYLEAAHILPYAVTKAGNGEMVRVVLIQS